MAYKVFEKNGIDIENIDGAEFNNFVANYKDGIIKDVLMECNVFSPSNNSITLSTGELIVKGVRIKITSAETKSFTSLPYYAENWHIVASVSLEHNKAINASILFRQKTALIKNDLWKTESQGVYESEIASFTLSNQGITNIKKTMNVFTPTNSENQGGSGNNITVDSELSTDSTNPVQNKVVTTKINEVNANALHANDRLTPLESRVYELENKEVEISVDAELSTESENPVQNKVVTEALGGKLDIVNTASTGARLYAISSSGEQLVVPLQATSQGGEMSAYAVARRIGYGHILLPDITQSVNLSQSDRNKCAVRYDYVHSLINSVKPYTHIVTITNESATIDITLTILSYSNNLFTSGINVQTADKAFLLDCSVENFEKIITIYAKGTGYNNIVSKPYYNLSGDTTVPVLFIETEVAINKDSLDLIVTDTIV